MACNDRQLSQAQREAGYDQQRTGVPRAVRPFSGAATLENLVDYLNRELVPGVQQTRGAINDVFLQVADNAPSANPLAFYFATATAAADPTVGRIRLNASPQNTASIIRVSQSNGRLVDVTPWLDVMSGGPTTPLGTVTLMDAINPGRFLRWDLNTMTDQGAYWDLGVTFIEGSTADPFVEGEAVTLGFIAGVSAAGSTVPVGSLSPVAADTFLGNITTSTAAPAAVPLASVDSTSLIYDATSHTFQRAALTGAISSTQNSNATLFAGIRSNGTINPAARGFINVVSTTSIIGDAGDDAVGNEIEFNFQRAALTGEATASQNSNAVTVTRSTNFQSSPWTGNHQFNGEVRLGTLHTETAVSGALNVTLTAGATRLLITSTADVTLGTISGGADGRLLYVEHVRSSGSGNLIVPHSTATNEVACPDGVDVTIGHRAGCVLIFRANVWRMAELGNGGRPRLVARRTIAAADASYSITLNSETTWFRARGVGAGGGGGGADAGEDESCAGGGGGAGATFEIALAITSGNITGQVGAGGAGGSNAGTDGTVGESTTLTYDGTTYTAGGGGGGFGTGEGEGALNGGTNVAVAPGGAGGTVGSLPTGAIGTDGGDGFPGLMFGIDEIGVSANTHMAVGGHGGPSFYGGGAQGGSIAGAAGTSNGTTAQAIGSGGAGGARVSSAAGATGATGSTGKDGGLVVEEWAGPVPTFATIS